MNRRDERRYRSGISGDPQLGKSATFFQELGYELDFETDHNSGQLSNRIGTPIFIGEVPESQAPGLQLVLRFPDAASAQLDAIGADGEFEETHFGTAMTTVTDPDGRVWELQAPLDKMVRDDT